MVSAYRRGETWWVKYRLGGRVVRKSLETKSAATAKKKVREIEAKRDLGQLDASGQSLLEDVEKEFLAGQRRIRSEGTIKAQVRHLASFRQHSRCKRIGDVEAKHVTAWLNSMNVANATRNQARASLHRFFVWAMQEGGFIDRNPVAMTTRAKETIRPREYLTAEVRDQVLEKVAGTALEIPIAIGVFAGLRREELVRLDWRDVELGHAKDLADAMLTVREAKSKRPRSVPISRRLYALLKKQRRRKGRVCWNGRALWTPDDLSREVRKLGREMKLKKLNGPHILRHTFGSLLAQAGESPQNIRAWMGHSSLLVTQRYMHLAPGRRGKIDEA